MLSNSYSHYEYLVNLVITYCRGTLAQNLYIESIALTSATYAVAIYNLVPAITFILTIFLRLYTHLPFSHKCFDLRMNVELTLPIISYIFQDGEFEHRNLCWKS